MPRSQATTSFPIRPGCVESIMLTGQQVAVDEMLTGRENLVLFGRLQGLSKSVALARADGTSPRVRSGPCREPAGRHLLRRDAPPHRHRLRFGGPTARWLFLDEPTTGLDPRSRQGHLGSGAPASRSAGIATLLTTQYLEEADALSDRIIVIDHGTIIAEGTADELKERTGGSYCEIVPQDAKDLPAMADALGPLLPEKSRAALTSRIGSDRHTGTDAAQAPSSRRVATRRGKHRAGRHRAAATLARRRIPCTDRGFRPNHAL